MMLNPLLIDIPAPLYTDRLRLYPVQPGEGSRLWAAISESRRELSRWLIYQRMPRSPEACEAYLREMSAQFLSRDRLEWLIVRRSDDLLIGEVALHDLDWTVPKFEIGYWIRTSVTGSGYAGEAVAAVVALSFDVLNAERLEIRCDSRNAASAAVARRAGFTFEGCLHANELDIDGAPCDTLVFSLLRDES